MKYLYTQYVYILMFNDGNTVDKSWNRLGVVVFTWKSQKLTFCPLQFGNILLFSVLYTTQISYCCWRKAMIIGKSRW